MKSVDQLINGVQTVFFRDIGQVGITRCCGWAGMPEDHLNMTKAQAAFE